MLTVFIAFSIASNAAAQQAAALENAARQSNDKREQMTLYYQAAEKYLSNNPAKASSNAHQSYLNALDLGDNVMAARAAYLNAEGFARQSKYGDAKFRYNRGKESSMSAKDYEFAAKCLDKMANMARSEGNATESATYAQQAKNLRNRGNTEGGGDIATITNGNNTPTPSPINRPTPTNQAELNGIKDQYRRLNEQYERDRQRYASDINLLKQEKASLDATTVVLRQKEAQLTAQSQQAQQTIEQQKGALASISTEKDALGNIASRKQKLYEILKNEKAIDSLAFAQEKQEQDLKLQKSRNFRNALLLILSFALVIVALIYRSSLENQKQKRILEDKNRQIEDERQRSDELLLNILPAVIATELKNNGKAKAHRYQQANVMFIDFKSFTRISEQLTPEDLVAELDHYFKAFDFIVGQYKLEKIKTIGDAYMVASGLSDRVSTPLSIVRAALEIQEFLADMKTEKSHLGKPFFEARVGIHSGPVVAGVVGVRKFAYDIWGDTVNIAARMQEACEPGFINVSEAVFNEIRYSFRCQYRGRLPAKNKGDIDMYYVDGVLK